MLTRKPQPGENDSLRFCSGQVELPPLGSPVLVADHVRDRHGGPLAPTVVATEGNGGLSRNLVNEHVATSSFASASGLRETYVSITGRKGHSRFSDALAEIGTFLEQSLGSLGPTPRDLVFSRLYLSDIENQKAAVRESLLFRQLSGGVVSIIEQPPLSGASVALLLYFVEGLSGRPPECDAHADVDDPWRNRRLFTGRSYSMMWGANYTAREGRDSAKQTRRLLTRFNQELQANSLSMKRDLLRTWVYVRDVDNRYQGMVDARRELFEGLGIGRDDRYPASTGIEGRAHGVNCLVDMDALAFGGLSGDQIIKMEALDYLSPTIRYGVTFERGIRIRFGDRSHLHLSGTASIDRHGKIVHPDDVLKQAERTIANMTALLEGQGASFDHMAYIILYLRDASFFEVVKQHLPTLIPRGIPLLPVTAAVCRPGWLIEMEGVAIAADDAPFPAFL